MGRSSKGQVLTCGACAVIVDESGEMTTSIDSMVNGVKRLFGRSGRRGIARHTAAVARF